MMPELFVLILAGVSATCLAWSFRVLPRLKGLEGQWSGVNLTYYVDEARPDRDLTRVDGSLPIWHGARSATETVTSRWYHAAENASSTAVVGAPINPPTHVSRRDAIS